MGSDSIEPVSLAPSAPIEMLYANIEHNKSSENLSLRLCYHFITRTSCISVLVTPINVCIY